jgi:hypothetical protein
MSKKNIYKEFNVFFHNFFFINKKLNKKLFNRDFGHYYYNKMYNHHWKIMSYNVVKKLT